MKKTYKYEVPEIKINSDSGKKLLGSGSGLRFLAGSGSDEYGSETLPHILLFVHVLSFDTHNSRYTIL